jgi:hypothetical protein
MVVVSESKNLVILQVDKGIGHLALASEPVTFIDEPGISGYRNDLSHSDLWQRGSRA